MTTTRIKVSKTTPGIKQVIKATYPEWKGRKVFVREATSYQLSDYWSEGSRNYIKAHILSTGATCSPDDAALCPFNLAAHATVEIRENVVLVEHSIYCGKDAGITIYVHPSNMPKFLPEVSSGQVLGS